MNKKLTGKFLPCRTETKIGDDMVWPSYDQGDLEWRLRYGSAGDMFAMRLQAAGVVEAYMELIRLPQRQRNAICNALKGAEE